jgi:hypothetical protein
VIDCRKYTASKLPILDPDNGENIRRKLAMLAAENQQDENIDPSNQQAGLSVGELRVCIFDDGWHKASWEELPVFFQELEYVSASHLWLN